MKHYIKRNDTILYICIFAVLTLAIFLAASAGYPVTDEAVADEVSTEVTSATTLTEPTGTVNVGGVDYKQIFSADELKYVLRTSTANKYILMNDFVVSDSTWCDTNSSASNNNYISGAVLGTGNVATDKKHSITFAPNSLGESVMSKNQYCGLFGRFGGTIKDMEFKFTGRIEIQSNVFTSGDVTVYAGGLAGYLTGTVDNCIISNTGSIYCYGQTAGRNLYVGSICGIYSGAEIKNSAISISGSLMAANKRVTTEAENKLDATSVKMYVGGIGGYAKRDGADNSLFTSNTLVVSATISTSEVSGHNFWDALNPFSYDEPNGDAYIFPVGGMFAYAEQIYITNCKDITISASLSAIGNEQSSRYGSAAGGIIGIAGSQAMININECKITLSGKLTTSNLCYVPNDFIIDWGGDKVGIVYQGGIVAKITDTINTNCKFQNIVLLKNSDFVQDTKSEKSPGGDFYGFLCGYPGASNSFASWNKGNIWIVGDVSNDSYRLASNVDGNKSVAYGVVHNLQVFGGGEVSVDFAGSKVIFYANPVFSPFYGWYEGTGKMATNTKYIKASEVGYDTLYDAQKDEQYKVYKYTPSTTLSVSVNMCLLFLTTEIYDAGNMVQFANEMNTGVPDFGETASGVALNFDWVDVNLMNDITFEQGLPVIRSFKGHFNGNGHNITFSANSRIVGKTKVGMFGVIEQGASVGNFNLNFAGDIYAGTQSNLVVKDTSNPDKPIMDENVTVGVLAAENLGEVFEIKMELSQAGVIKACGQNAIVGGLIGLNKPSGTVSYALRQIDVTIDGKISVIGVFIQLGGLIGRSECIKKYEMINLYAKGEIVGSVTDSNSCKTHIGGLIGMAGSAVEFSNTVVNIREYSNYNNDVLLCSCKHNETTYSYLMEDAAAIQLLGTNGWTNAEADLTDILSYFGTGDDCLRVAARSQESYDEIETRLTVLVNKVKNNQINRVEANEEFQDLFGIMSELDCSAQCPLCDDVSTAFALIGNIGSYGKIFSNTWVLGSYSQYPDVLNPQPADVGTSKLFFLNKSDTTTKATGEYGLNLIYVRGGSSYCIMDISSISENNILFTVSVDTTKVFTGWYKTFNHSEMVDDNMLVPEGFKPGSRRSQIYYSSVIESLVSTYDMLNMIAVTTNAGQNYEGTEFVLGGDIICPGSSTYVPIGSEERPFCGTFDGKGYKISIYGNFPQTSLANGVFGCVGSQGVVKQLTVVYETNAKSSVIGAIFGGIAAFNKGVIGQDSTSNKNTVIFKQRVQSATTSGGIVGINEGSVINVAVSFVDVNPDVYGMLLSVSNGSGDIYNAAVSGGVVALNKSSGIVKNAIVKSNVISTDNYASNIVSRADTGSAEAYAGGIVGYNEGVVYSVVSELTHESSNASLAKINGANGYAGTLVGYNKGLISDLWALYSFSDNNLYHEPAKNGEQYSFSLVNGDNAGIGNRLIKYGTGEIEVGVYANNELQSKGGTIIFKAKEIKDNTNTVIPFYNYTTSMSVGTIVSSVDGGSGQNFAPRLSTESEIGLNGCVYYAVFVRTEIRSKADFYAFAKTVNDGFAAYANYIINLTGATSLQLSAVDDGYTSVGSVNPFVGNFNGNGFLISMTGAIAGVGGVTGNCLPLFGIIAKDSVIQNLSYSIGSDAELRTPVLYNDKTVLGFFANVNFGLLTNVYVTTTGCIFGNTDYAGGMVGYNGGTISTVTMSFKAENVQGFSRAGTVYGCYAGGIAGYNSGTIGSDRLDSVKLVLSADQENRASIYGIYAVGGIVGTNYGIINNVNSKISGKLATATKNDSGFYMGTAANGDVIYKSGIGSYFTALGLIVGENKSKVLSAVAYSYNTARLIALGSGNNALIGGVTGVNDISAVIGSSDIVDSVKVFFHTAITENYPNSFGGIAARNSGSIYSSNVHLESHVRADVYVGGLCGLNGGDIYNCSVSISAAAKLVAGVNAETPSYAGGGVGRNDNLVYGLAITSFGVIGDAGITGTVGGLIGYNSTINFRDSYAVLSQTVLSFDKKGLAVGYSVNQTESTSNVWAVASNSDTTPACGNGAMGFNVLKIVGNAYVNANFVNGQTDTPVIKFTAPNIAGMEMKWYSNISALESSSSASSTFNAEISDVNCVFHVCYFDLVIDTAEEFSNIYQYVNAYNLFNGVMFRLNNDITIKSTLQPIGTLEHPFNGIFDGNYNKITFESGGIAGSSYSGVFGYVADNAIISNLIVEIGKDVIVGSGMSDCAGVLAGRLGGTVENVSINLYSAPYSLKDSAHVGALAGMLSEEYLLNNVWVVIYNSAVKKIGGLEPDGRPLDEDTGLNSLAVLGSGVLSVEFQAYGQGEFVYTVTESFDYFNEWYFDISTRKTILDMSNPAVYGMVTGNPEEHIVTYLSRPTLLDMNYTISFIDLEITSSEDFVRFAENVNKYGDGGAKFTMNFGRDSLGNVVDEITIDMSVCPPIGTAEHPFTGCLEGTMDLSASTSYLCNTIRLSGNLTSEQNEYSGLFGYVGAGAVIRNLIIRADNADENPDYTGQKFGDKRSIYTGYLAAYLNGTLENVTVIMGEQTEIYNINSDSFGGLVGMMGYGSTCINSWLVLPENSKYRVIGGYKNIDGDIVAYNDDFKVAYPSVKLPNVMYKCGSGLLDISLQKTIQTAVVTPSNLCWKFSLTPISGGEQPYGFIDKTVYNPTKQEVFTSAYGLDICGVEYLALFLDPIIDELSDLIKLAELTNSGRSYIGIEFKQSRDIVLDNSFIPIGGQVKLEASGALGTEYKLVEFNGAYNGNGNKLIVPADVTINGLYAGLFGILGKDARISNIYLEVSGTIGSVSSVYSDSTVYAGTIAALDYGATLKNIIVILEKSASLNAAMDTGRVCVDAQVQTDVHGVITNSSEIKSAENVWVLVYNNKYNNGRNSLEQGFYDNDDDSLQGKYNGGINVLTIIAAGTLGIEFVRNNELISGVRIYNPNHSSDPENISRNVQQWYTIDNGIQNTYGAAGTSGEFYPDTSISELLLYASFLKDTISSVDDLIKLAQDTNDGYDLYGLTFRLTNDISIVDNSYVAVGGDAPFNATLDGNGHTITLNSSVNVRGKYAGIIGNLGTDGVVKNLVMRIDGQLGYCQYTETEEQEGKQNTLYAGAVAYIQGKLDSVIIIGTNASVEGAESKFGIAFGYDVKNLLTNVWLITNAENSAVPFGTTVAAGGESTINVMRVIGMGILNTQFRIEGGSYLVAMSNSVGDYAVKGWYSNYSKDNQLSEALGVHVEGTSITAGDSGSFTARHSLINRRYEVVIINTVINTVSQLLSIANDVNIGGYSFENTSFALGSDLVVTQSDFISIGNETTPFRGSFSGSHGGSYYSLNMNMSITNLDNSKTDCSVPLFGYNAGIITDLEVIVTTSISMPNSVVGVVAQYNYGTISNTLVKFAFVEKIVNNEPAIAKIEVSGSTVGGIAGYNDQDAFVENCIIIIPEHVTLRAKFIAGGIVGDNYGKVTGSTGGGGNSDFAGWEARFDPADNITEYANVLLHGSISVEISDSSAALYAGGAVGISQNLGYINKLIVRIRPTGRVFAKGNGIAVGGIIGRSSATLRNSVIISEGLVIGEGKEADVGYFVGNIQGSATNSWMVTAIPEPKVAIGNGYESVNSLEISGNGVIDVYVDADNNIIFTNITPEGGASLDGWYVNNGVSVTDSIGNQDEKSFRPNVNITGRTVNVVFINTEISTVDDLIVMANTVNSGLFADSLTFILKNDLIIDSNSRLTACVGIFTEDGAYGFKHIFEGGGNTITIVSSEEDCSVDTQAYMGIFGYTTSSAVIKNLTVKYTSGNYGEFTTVAFGGISGINAGSIENCVVYIGSAPVGTESNGSVATIRGQSIGGIAGVNMRTGIINQCKFYNYGTLYAESRVAADNTSPNSYAGGISGSNAGTVNTVDVLLSPVSGNSLQAVYIAPSAGATYVGGISGSNSGTIEHANIRLVKAPLLSSSQISAYAGGIVGSNIGTVQYAYIDIGDGSIIKGDNRLENVSGGITGINSYFLKNIVVKITSLNIVGDSAVGQYRAMTSSANNVWVYNNNSLLNSSVSDINNMTYFLTGPQADNPSVSHNSVEEIVGENSNIIFYATLLPEIGITLFADAHTNYSEVLYNKDYIDYESDGGSKMLVLRSPDEAKSIWVMAAIRREINHQSEMKMLAKAVASGVQEVNGIYSLGQDITITGDYLAVGTTLHPFNATFDGNHYRITFDVTGEEKTPVVYGSELHGTFGVNAGILRNLNVMYNYSLNSEFSAGLCVDNGGEIRDSVVYTAKDVVLTSPIAKGKSNRNNNLWHIARIGSNGETVLGSNSLDNKYSAIVINGNGDLIIKRNVAALTFVPVCRTEGMVFAGFSDQAVIEFATDFITTSEMVTAMGCNFSALFISSNIENRSDLLALVGALENGYGEFSEKQTYTITGDDIEVTEQEISGLKDFLGTIDGNDKILKIVSGDTEQDDVVFLSDATKNTTFRDITFDIRGLNSGIFLFEISSKIVLYNVSIIDYRPDTRLYDDQSASVRMSLNNVFVVTDNQTTFNDISYQTPGVGYILVDGSMDVTFESDAADYFAIAHSAQDEIFAGWYMETATGSEFQKCETPAILLLSNAYKYKTYFISTAISVAEDIDAIKTAVTNGFEFLGEHFRLTDDITIELNESIGDFYSFSAELDGSGHTLNVTGGCPVFKTLAGTVKNLVLRTDSSQGVAVTLRDGSVLENVVVISDTVGAATVAEAVNGVFVNAWLVATQPIAQGTLNRIVANTDAITASVVITDKIKISVASVEADQYVKWYQNDAVYFNENYDYIEASEASEVAFTVSSTASVADSDDLKVLATAVSHGYNRNVNLSTDIALDSTYVPIVGFSGRFQGNGHTITVSELTQNFALFKDTYGTIVNLKLAASSKQAVSVAISEVGDEISSLNNCVIELSGSTTAVFQGEIVNLWVIQTFSKTTTYAEFSAAYAGYGNVNVLGINQGEIVSTITDGVISFDGGNNDGLAFLGYSWGDAASVNLAYTVAPDASGVRLFAFFADSNLDSVESWNVLAGALEATGNNGSGLSFTLSSDITVTAGFKKINSFKGKLDGVYNSFVLNAEAQKFQGIISLAEGGEILNLAVEIFSKDGFRDGYEFEFPSLKGVDNCWVLDYVGGITTDDVGAARLISVNNMASKPLDGGIISVTAKNNAFNFTPNDLPEYKLRAWKSLSSGNALTQIGGSFYVSSTLTDGKVVETSVLCKDASIEAVFFSCYTVSILIDGVDNSAVKPDVSKTQTYWSDDNEPKSIVAKSTKGYMFWGFEYDADPAITAVNEVELSIDVVNLHASIDIVAKYSLIATDWTTVQYGDKSVSEMKEYLVIDPKQVEKIDGMGCHINRACQSEGDTLETVDDMPFHAGNYCVIFRIVKNIEVGGKIKEIVFGEATFGFTVLPRVLQFTELTLDEKAYDTTVYGNISSRKLWGFIDADNYDDKIATLDFTNVKLAYFDSATGKMTANAGSGYNVVVHPDSYLDSKSDSVFFHIDYTLPSGILYRYSEKLDGTAEKLEAYSFGIEKADLTLTISTISVNYLDQFKISTENSNKPTLFAIDDLFRNCYKFNGIQGNDEETIKNTKLLVIDGDSITYGKDGVAIYNYHIRTPGDYAISTLTDALKNYNPKISGASARFRVVATPVTVRLNNMTNQYGYSLDVPDYHFHEGLCECQKDDNGLCAKAFTVSPEQFRLLAEEFEIHDDYNTFLSKYLSVKLSTEYLYETDSKVAIVNPVPVEGHNYGVSYRFLCENVNFELVDNEAVTVYKNTNKEYIICQNTVLHIAPREMVIEYTGVSGKLFAAADGDFAASVKAVGVKPVSGDSITVFREHAGESLYEMVGDYKLSFIVKNAAGQDISAYYNLTTASGSDYMFTIHKREVKLSHTGYSYYYGDKAAQSNMSCTLNISSDIREKIVRILSNNASKKTFADIGISYSLGYFGSELQNVGTYFCELRYDAPDAYKNCLDFVCDAKSCTYTIIPAKLTITTKDTSRLFNKTNNLTFADGFTPLVVKGILKEHEKFITVTSNEYKGDIGETAGIYFYRPDICKLQAVSSEYEYLLDNYTIDKISDGRYTILALAVIVKAEMGYYNEGTFVRTSNKMYIGDKRAALRFSVAEELPGYLAELYRNDIEGKLEEMTDRQLSDWYESILSLKYSDINQFGVSTRIEYAPSSGENVKSIYLRSSDANIKISTSGSFAVDEVHFVVENIVLTKNSGEEKPKLSGTVKAYDFDNRLLEGYEFNDKIEGLSDGESFNLSNGIQFKFEVVNYAEDGNCSYNLSTLISDNGRWVQPKDELLYVINNDRPNQVQHDSPLTLAVVVEYSSWEKLLAFITGSPAAFASILAALLVLISGICVLASVIHHNKKIAKAAFRDQLNEQILAKNNISISTDEEIKQNESKPDDLLF